MGFTLTVSILLRTVLPTSRNTILSARELGPPEWLGKVQCLWRDSAIALLARVIPGSPRVETLVNSRYSTKSDHPSHETNQD